MERDEDDKDEVVVVEEDEEDVDVVDAVDPVDAVEEGDKGETTSTEEDPEADAEMKGLSEKQQEQMTRRIGKVVAREKSRTEAAEARASAAEEKLKNVRMEDAETGLPFPSDYVKPDEVAVLKKLSDLKASKRTLRPLRSTGYKGRDGTDYTPEQVEERLDEIDDDIERIQGKAATIRARAEGEFAADMKELRELRKQKQAGTLNKGKLPKGVERKAPPAAPGSARNAGAGGGGRQPQAAARGVAVDKDAVFDKDSFREQVRKSMAG